MAKKRVKRKSSHSRTRRASVSMKRNSSVNYEKRSSKVLRSLGLSFVLFIISTLFYYAVSGALISDILWVTSLVTGFVSLALFIAYLVLLFTKLLGK